MLRRRAQEADSMIARGIKQLAREVFGYGVRVSSLYDSPSAGHIKIRIWPIIVAIEWGHYNETVYTWWWELDEEDLSEPFQTENRLHDRTDIPAWNGHGDRDQMIRFLYELRGAFPIIKSIAKEGEVAVRTAAVDAAREVFGTAAYIEYMPRGFHSIDIKIGPVVVAIDWVCRALVYTWVWVLSYELPIYDQLRALGMSKRDANRYVYGHLRNEASIPEITGTGNRTQLLAFFNELKNALPTIESIIDEVTNDVMKQSKGALSSGDQDAEMRPRKASQLLRQVLKLM